MMVVIMASAFWFWPLKRSDARAPITMLACAASPVLSSLGVGQDVAVVMLLVAISARLLLAGRPSAAGLAASIIFAVKLTYLPAIALVFLVRHAVPWQRVLQAARCNSAFPAGSRADLPGSRITRR
jgi:Glycosyltransferase family 87